MAESSLLRQIGEANKSFLAGNPRFLDPAGEPFVVVACIDPRLTGFLEPALGLPKNRAAIIRTAGNQLTERTRDALRSIAVALFVKNAREIVVVGHTDCGMAGFSVAEVTDNFRKAGIPRGAFGDEDLRVWFGAFPSIRDNVISSVDFLRKSGFVPRDVKAHGLILDTAKGTIEVVVDGDIVAKGAPLPVVALEPEPPPPPVEMEKHATAGGMEEQAAAQPAAPATEQKPVKGPVIIGKPVARKDQPAPPRSLLEAAMVLRDFFNRERQTQRMQKSIDDLKAIWKQEKSPHLIMAELEKIARTYQSQYPSLPGALVYLEDAIKTGSADKIGFGEVLKRILD